MNDELGLRFLGVPYGNGLANAVDPQLGSLDLFREKGQILAPAVGQTETFALGVRRAQLGRNLENNTVTNALIDLNFFRVPFST